MPRFSRRLFACLGALAGCAGGALGLLQVGPAPQRSAPRPLASPPPPAPAPPSKPARVLDLRPGVGEWTPVAEGALHVLRFAAPADMFVVLEIEQDHIDVVVTVVDPGGRRLPPVDSRTGETGTERVVFLSPAMGTYQAEVKAWGQSDKQGSYRSRFTLRPPTARDRREALAEQIFYTAKARADRRDAREEDRIAATAGYREAADIFRDLGEPAREREAWELRGKLFSGDHEWQDAHDAYASALPLARALKDSRDEAYVENEIGFSAENLEDLTKAEAAYRRALDIWREIGEKESEAKAWVNLGHIATKQGEIWESLSCFERALKLGQGSDTRARALAGRGTARSFAGDFRPAFEDFRAALALLAPNARDLRAVILTKMGDAYLEEGVLALALARYKEALPLRRALRDRYGEAVTLNGIGLVQFHRHEYQSARNTFQALLNLFEQLENPRGVTAALINLGWAETNLGKPNAALTLYRRVLPLAQQLGDRKAEAAVHFGMAWAEHALRNPIAARAAIAPGLAIVEGLRGEAKLRNLAASYLATKRDLYDLLIDLLMEQHRVEPLAGYDAEALAVSERARGRSLLDALAGQPGIDPLTPVAIERQVLDDRTLLLEYSLGEERSVLWVVSSKGLASFELPPREKIEAAVRQSFELIKTSYRPRQGRAARRAALDLSRTLLGPVAGLLADKRLLVVPDGVLDYVPFAALPDLTAAAGSSTEAWPEPIVLRHAVTEIASASVLAALRTVRLQQKPPPGLLALFYDAVTDPGDGRLEGRSVAAPPSSFPRLSWSATEAAGILALAPAGEILEADGFAADRRRVLARELGRYRNLHFSTHGIFDPVHPERSALVLSLWDRTGSPLNGFLRSDDLEGLHLPADLAVLSGCETARGRELRGEGLLGLTQGFLAAGTARVLVSLWQVPDRSTAILMERFYRAMWQDHLSPAAALQAAQASMWRQPEFRAPYYWAGFVLQGEPR